MTFRQYRYLDEENQERVCWQYGVLVAERRVRGYIYQLYQVGGFYIEVKYSISLNSIQSFTAFESTDELDPYLQGIPLEWI